MLFCVVQDAESANKAISEMNGYLLGVKPLYVNVAQRKEVCPRIGSRPVQIKHSCTSMNELLLGDRLLTCMTGQSWVALHNSAFV